MAETLAIVSLALTTPPVIETIIRFGKDLGHRIELFKGLSDSLEGLSIFRDEASKTKMRFNLGHKICTSPDPSIDSDIRSSLDQKFQEIQQTINEANHFVIKLEKGGLRNFWRLDELRRDAERRIQLLKAAIASFNDTIILVHIEQAGPPNAKLTTDIFRHSTEGSTTISKTTSLARCHLARNVNKLNAKKGPFLLEARPYKANTKSTLENNLAYLAQTLIDADMSISMLRAVGYTDDSEHERFLLVFNVPDTLVPAGTLQLLLQSVLQMPSLNVRVALCSKLANAIFDVHSLRLVHKNVNSASIIVMTPGGMSFSGVTDRDIRTFLLNWHLVRKIDEATVPSPEQK
ncbi:MAG: hypothetical protein Q9164_006783, partial [Protoblastenia rupestris]